MLKMLPWGWVPAYLSPVPSGKPAPVTTVSWWRGGGWCMGFLGAGVLRWGGEASEGCSDFQNNSSHHTFQLILDMRLIFKKCKSADAAPIKIRINIKLLTTAFKALLTDLISVFSPTPNQASVIFLIQKVSSLSLLNCPYS